MRKKIGGILLLALLCLLVWGSHRLSHLVIQSSVLPAENGAENLKIIIDAGHGGSDGGKVGVNDVVESEINLQIAKLVQERLEGSSIQVIMTREGDEGMAEGNAADLRARVELINEEAPDLVVSIHQNSYTDAGVKGSQVFYHENSEDGKRAAEMMQEALLALDESNSRQAKSNTTYFLLKRTEVPAIIVECGFLSNWEEAEKLAAAEYQERVADAVFVGICNYFGIVEN